MLKVQTDEHIAYRKDNFFRLELEGPSSVAD